MRVQVAKWGNSTALRLPKAIVDELGLVPGQEIDVSVEAGEARLKPLRKKRRLIEDLVEEMRRLGPENAPPLEDRSAIEPPWPDWEDDKT